MTAYDRYKYREHTRLIWTGVFYGIAFSLLLVVVGLLGAAYQSEVHNATITNHRPEVQTMP